MQHRIEFCSIHSHPVIFIVQPAPTVSPQAPSVILFLSNSQVPLMVGFVDTIAGSFRNEHAFQFASPGVTADLPWSLGEDPSPNRK